MFFTNYGKAFKIKAYEIPEAQRTAKGTPIINFLQLMQQERITAMIPIRDMSDNSRFLIAVTKRGVIKKTMLSEFDTNRKAGLIAITLKEGDALVGIKETTGTANVILITKKGKCITFKEDDVRAMGRLAAGVRAIELEGDDEVVAMELAEKNEELFVCTSRGYGKRTSVKEYKLQSRGGKGLLTYDKSKFDKTGYLIGGMSVKEDDEILLINSDGVIIRVPASDVSRLSRATQGVRIMRVGEDAEIIAMAKAVREDEEPSDDDPDPVPAKPAKSGKGAAKPDAEPAAPAEDEQLSLL